MNDQGRIEAVFINVLGESEPGDECISHVPAESVLVGQIKVKPPEPDP